MKLTPKKIGFVALLLLAGIPAVASAMAPNRKTEKDQDGHTVCINAGTDCHV